jgi:excisionase family DNA binding protein
MAYRSVNEAAARLGISPWLAYRLIERGELPHVRLGRRIVVPDRALDDWMNRRALDSTADQDAPPAA